MSEQVVKTAMGALRTVWQVDDYVVGKALWREGWTELACANDKQRFAFRMAQEQWIDEQLGQQEISQVRPDDPTRWAWVGNYADVDVAENRADWVGV